MNAALVIECAMLYCIFHGHAICIVCHLVECDSSIILANQKRVRVYTRCHATNVGCNMTMMMTTKLPTSSSSLDKMDSTCIHTSYHSAVQHSQTYYSFPSQAHSSLYDQWLKPLLSRPNTKRIFMFSMLNLIFTVVELLTGWLCGSLSLMSDGCHMFLDTSVLFVNLLLSVLSTWPPSQTYPLGYGRIEAIAGLINSLLLLFLSGSIACQAFQRYFDPLPVLMDTPTVLFVAVLGLALNLIGVHSFTHDPHDHHRGEEEHIPTQSICCNDGHDNGYHHVHSPLFQGMFLHVLADALGSVAVILSTLLIRYTGWVWIDPFCSLFLSLFVLVSVIPLVKATFSLLMLASPVALQERIMKNLSSSSFIVERVLLFPMDARALVGIISVSPFSGSENEATAAKEHIRALVHRTAKEMHFSISLLSIEVTTIAIKSST